MRQADQPNCPRCLARLPGAARFCPECGRDRGERERPESANRAALAGAYAFLAAIALGMAGAIAGGLDLQPGWLVEAPALLALPVGALSVLLITFGVALTLVRAEATPARYPRRAGEALPVCPNCAAISRDAALFCAVCGLALGEVPPNERTRLLRRGRSQLLRAAGAAAVAWGCWVGGLALGGKARLVPFALALVAVFGFFGGGLAALWLGALGSLSVLFGALTPRGKR